MDNARSTLPERKINRLKQLVSKYRASRQLHTALLKLSEHASKVPDLTLLYPAIQRILKNNLFCKNFYVVLYNTDSAKLELTYFIDENYETESSIPKLKQICLEHSLSGLVFKTNQAQLLNKQQILDYEAKGVCQVIGKTCEHWLGVPIQHEGRTIGVMATQSYNIEHSFNQNQINLFETVAFYFSTAIERVKKRQYMAQEIEKKTELLRFEVAKNKDTIRKKNMLYAISKLATTSLSNSNFYAQVHEVINEEVFAKNLFIALKSNTHDDILFPYAVDETSSDLQTKKFNQLLTELVIDSGKIELFDRQRILDEIRNFPEYCNEVKQSLLPTSWIGVPLYHRQQVIGVLACQAFKDEYSYKQADIDLISFVSEQISNVIVKHEADNELEKRVEEKTVELQHANIHLQLQIEERKKVERQLFHDAHHDNLTGLANRSLFISQLEKTVQRYKRDQSTGYAVLFIDLDNFKQINDSLGHHAGDRYLKLTANAFSACIREHDLLARFGGDEFVILLTHLQTIDEAKTIAQRIVTLMNNPFNIDGIQVQSGASIGIAYSNKQYNDADDIISDADSAMYIAKKSGKGTIKLNKSNSHANKSILANQSLNTLAASFSNSKVTDLSNSQKFASHIKAMLDIGSGVKLELNRLIEKLHQPISYCDFLVEQVSNYLPTENTVLFQLHPSALEEEFEMFFEQLNKQHRNICWMFSYDSVTKLSTSQIQRLRQLKEMGFNLALSDVAKNQIDIVKLTCIPFDFFILDHSFCRRLINESTAQTQLTALIALGQNSNSKIIATGPNIVSFQSSLKKLGIQFYLNQTSEKFEQQQSNTAREENAKTKLN